MSSTSAMFFGFSVILISLLLLGLIVGSECIAAAGNRSAYVTSSTTWWVYAAIAFAIAIIMLLILLYLGYAWSCACSMPKMCDMPKPSCPPKKPKCAPACY